MRDYVMVVGSGMMGSGIGAMSALAGNKTVLIDVEESRVRSGIEKAVSCIRLREQQGLNSREEADRAVQLLEGSTDMAESAGCGSADRSPDLQQYQWTADIGYQHGVCSPGTDHDNPLLASGPSGSAGGSSHG